MSRVDPKESKQAAGQSTHQKSGRSWSLILLRGLILLQGVSGLLGGAGLMLNPTGAELGMEQGLLEGSPFESYLIPGAILFFVLGVFPTVTFIGLLKLASWAFWASLAVGLGLCIWIGVQIAMIGYFSQPPLQVIFGILGVVIVVLTLNPGLRRQFIKGGESRW